VFPKEAEINFYRVAQETVSNVVKHSAATEASVIVRREDGRIALTVRDNGKGFGPEPAQPETLSGGFGLVGISERVTLLGGHTTIQSAPGTWHDYRHLDRSATHGRCPLVSASCSLTITRSCARA
jgi:signal transduction histidine kinase